MLSVIIDAMHVLDLGVCQHVAGSIIYILVMDTGLTCRFEEKLQTIWPKLVEQYDNLGTPAGERLSWHGFVRIFENSRSGTPQDPVTLHSKAAVCRNIMPALKLVLQNLDSWVDFFDETVFGHALELATHLSNFYETLFAHDFWFPECAAEDAKDSLQCAGVHHMALCNLMSLRGRTLFYMTEKAHDAQHIALECVTTRLNPRFGWNSSDEDYMGRMKQIIGSRTRAGGSLRLGVVLFFRWRNRLWIRWSRRARNEQARGSHQ